jgi:cyclin B
MTEQADINEKMRAILIDWLIDVHLKYKMVAETLFLTVYLIDKYLECNQVSRQRLQLVGIAALFLASKYEEIYPPQLRDFIEVTDRSYSKYELLEMESKIVGALNFSLTVPSTLRFLERYARLLTSD